MTEKYWQNPQFVIKIEANELQLEAATSECSVIVGLMQKNTRRKRTELGVDSSTEEFINVRVFKQASNGQPVEMIASSGPYMNKREVTCRCMLRAGSYVIVASCYDSDVEGEFIVRLFTEKPMESASRQVFLTINNYFLSNSENSNLSSA